MTNLPFIWSNREQRTLPELKRIMMEEIVLTLPDLDKELIISYDATHSFLGAVLQQQGEHGLKPIAYASRVLL
jgi:hypothetical protein